MQVMKSDEVKTNFKAACDSAWNGEPVCVVRPKSHNVVLISEPNYRQIIELQNAELDRRIADVEAGRVITLTFEEMEALEDMTPEEGRAFARERREQATKSWA